MDTPTTNTTADFRDLNVGDCFEYAGYVWIKIRNIEVDTGAYDLCTFNAVRLTDGDLDYFGYDQRVFEVNKFKIERK